MTTKFGISAPNDPVINNLNHQADGVFKVNFYPFYKLKTFFLLKRASCVGRCNTVTLYDHPSSKSNTALAASRYAYCI